MDMMVVKMVYFIGMKCYLIMVSPRHFGELNLQAIPAFLAKAIISGLLALPGGTVSPPLFFGTKSAGVMPACFIIARIMFFSLFSGFLEKVSSWFSGVDAGVDTLRRRTWPRA